MRPTAARQTIAQGETTARKPAPLAAPPYLWTVSGKRIEIVRRLLERWSKGDLGGFIEGVDPELEWRTSGIYPDVDPVYYGHEGFRKFWRDFHEAWETLSMELRDSVVVGDQVAFSFHFDATGRDGVRAGRDQASLVTLRNGLLLRIQNYASWDEALEALEPHRR
jgi:ketosteroid isomerase-like protein